MKKLPNWVKNTLYSLVFILIVLGLILSADNYYKVVEGTPFNKSLAVNNTSLPYDTNKYIYLSDIDYVSDMSYVKSGYYFKKDKNNLNGLIEVNVKDKENNLHKETFIKGISAWATSEIVYDVKDLNYDYFTAYVGVDANQTSTYYNSGVNFTIYTSVDGETWKNAYTSKNKKGWDEADFVEIPLYETNEDEPEIKGPKIKYLKLYAYENGNSWYSHWHDDAVYANARLVKEGYNEEKKTYDIIKTLDEYDEEIKKISNLNDFGNLENYQSLLLQREFVSRVGYDILQALFNYSEDYQNIIKDLFEDDATLELYLLGGKPDGNYVESLKLLSNLFKKYKDDFTDDESGKLYKKMAISLSLTHSANVGLWVSGAPEDPDDPNGSNAIDRYAIYKKLYQAGKLNNKIFTNLSVEEMRFVMNNIIDDEEIIWLNDYTRVNNSMNPYTYINYTFGYDYSLDKYYDLSKKSEWNNKKHGNLEFAYHFDDGTYFTDLEHFNRSDYDITYQKGYPKLWIVFEEGSVCGGLSKTGSNIEGVYGIPSSVVSQPGHAAYIYMDVNEKGEKYWRLYNDVSGWGQSGKTEKLSVRMPNGWGDGDYVGSYPATYVLLAQSALNDLTNYEKAEKVLMLASLYSNPEDKIKIYEEALSIQNINFDAWLGLVNAYKENKATDSKYIELAKRITTTLRNYPLPMDDLLKLIQKDLQDDSFKTELTNLTDSTLKDVKEHPDSNYIQSGAAKQVATYLLQSHGKLATFSFDGKDAKTIKLNSDFITEGVQWEYSVDSGEHWSRASGLTHTLTDEEVDTIHHETEILIKIIGKNNENSIYEIPIEVSYLSSNLSYNDKENIINTGNDDNSLGYSKSALEWKLSTENDEAWKNLDANAPDLSGNKSIDIRVGRHENFLASDKLTFEFTAIGENDAYSRIDNNKIKIDAVSSEEKNQEDNKKENALDDSLSTMWHTSWDGSDKERFIVLKLDNPTLLSALEYVPRQAGDNGMVIEAEISTSMDGINYTPIETEKSLEWEPTKSGKYAIFKKPVEALYVKLHGKQTLGDGRSFMSAASISLFEDATPKNIPSNSKSRNIEDETLNKETNTTENNNNSTNTNTNDSSTNTTNNESKQTKNTTNNSTSVNSSNKNKNTNNSVIEDSSNNDNQNIDTNTNNNNSSNEDTITFNNLHNNDTLKDNNIWTSPGMIAVYVITSLGIASLIIYLVYKRRY